MSAGCIEQKAFYRVTYSQFRLNLPIEGRDGRFVLLAEQILDDNCISSKKERNLTEEIKGCIEKNAENPQSCHPLFKRYLVQFCMNRSVNTVVNEIENELKKL